MGGPGSGRKASAKAFVKAGEKGRKTGKAKSDPRMAAQLKANRAQDKAAKQMKAGTIKSAYTRKGKGPD